MKKPELVLPAGDLEKLKTAVIFGADAIYIGGKNFSLRAYAGNFAMPEIKEGLDFAHFHNKKVYVTVNILAHNDDLKELPAYLEKLAELKVDGMIISDLGVLRIANKYAPSVPKTISTQANVTNYESALLYKELGAKRIVLARELNLREIEEIKNKAEVEVEIFVHGAMCVSYSGRCLLSYYMTGRSANRGECAHPCRYKYVLEEEKRPGQYFPIEEDERGTYILNSRDLCLLEYIPRLIDIGIDAFKVEGRMKSPLYIASVASVYKKAIERYLETGTAYDQAELEEWMKELCKTATRPFTNGFIEGESPLLQDINKTVVENRASFCGIVVGYDKENNLVKVEQRGNFGCGDNLELLLPDGKVYSIKLNALYDENMENIERARHAKQIVFFETDFVVPVNSILRKVEEDD
ncbi:U32 family peptidase [Thermosyntropha sp.]|uniref:peptidase U32 family protein n=1 Tax=Thermosyntropha sp. TaxID=2740820 RepID=UPI0025F5CD26|nr:U32 family peptidase [Thermosyntropha sp.]MBO8159807.1 U32 family peptidase [Thermosyntropha sp.]